MLVRCMCRSGCVPKEGATISNRPSGLSCATQWPAAPPPGQRPPPANRVWADAEQRGPPDAPLKTEKLGLHRWAELEVLLRQTVNTASRNGFVAKRAPAYGTAAYRS